MKLYIKIGVLLWGENFKKNCSIGYRPQKDWDDFINLSFSQEGEDLILHRLIGYKQEGFYIDVGAHHPYRFSNTFKFYLMGWKGINIDALPGSKKFLDEKRPRDINIESGILNKTGESLTYYMFQEPALNTFNEQVALNRKNTDGICAIGERKIPCYKLSEILDKTISKETPIDFLSIDVEGMDLEVLQSNNWQLYRPRYIMAESLSTSLINDFKASISVFLQQQGYKLIAKTANTLLYTSRQ